MNQIPRNFEQVEQKLLETQKNQLKQLRDRRAYVELFLSSKLVKSHKTKGYFSHNENGLYLLLYNIDLPTVIDHVCTPIHQVYKLDWKLQVDDHGEMELTTISRYPLPKFTIFLYEQEMASCSLVRVKVGEKTEEELKQALLNATDKNRYEYKINCADEEEE